MKIVLQSWLVVLIYCLVSATPVVAQCGYLDQKFGTDGIVVTSIDTANADAAAVAVQADGKIVAAGKCRRYGFDCFTLVRYTSTGLSDPTFGLGGVAVHRVGIANSNITAIAIQPDGKIVAGGISMLTNAISPKLTLARFKSNGKFDSTFSQDGILIPANNWVVSGGKVYIALLPDNKIIAAAQTGTGVHAIYRYNSDGNPDSTFGSNGSVITGLQTIDYELSGFTVQADGKILTTGTCVSLQPQYAMLRYNATGTIDTAFGSGGMVYFPIQSPQSRPVAVAERPDGKLSVAVCKYYNHPTVTLYGFNSDGSVDNAFGTNGKVTASPLNPGVLFAMLIRPDGNIMVTGSAGIDNFNAIFVLSYKADGTPDALFDRDGLSIITADSKHRAGEAIALSPDGDIIIAGIQSDNNGQDILVARYRGCPVSPEFTTLTVYPNPGDGTPALQTDNILTNATLEVYNMLGEKILEQTGLNGQIHFLDAESLLAGTYYFQLTQDGKILGGGKYIKVKK